MTKIILDIQNDTKTTLINIPSNNTPNNDNNFTYKFIITCVGYSFLLLSMIAIFFNIFIFHN